MVAFNFNSLAECPFCSQVLSSVDRPAWEKEDPGPQYCSCHVVLVESRDFNLELYRTRTTQRQNQYENYL